MRDKENMFKKYKGKYTLIKHILRLEFKLAQNFFDKILRKKERAYNRNKILSFDTLDKHNPKEFLNKLKGLGPIQNTKIPVKVKMEEDFVTDPKIVLDKWKNYFSSLYNSPYRPFPSKRLPYV